MLSRSLKMMSSMPISKATERALFQAAKKQLQCYPTLSSTQNVFSQMQQKRNFSFSSIVDKATSLFSSSSSSVASSIASSASSTSTIAPPSELISAASMVFSAAEADVSVITTTLASAIASLQASSGLPYWSVIALITIVIRLALTPLAIKNMKTSFKLAGIAPQTQALAAKMREMATNGDQNGAMATRLEMQGMFQREGVHPFSPMLLPLVQAPIFIAMFSVLRHMSDTMPALKEGGLWWFTDLSVPDPILALPIMSSLLMLATVELGGEVPSPQQNKTIMKNVMRVISLAMIPITMSMPSSVVVYWTTSSFFSAIQTALLQRDSIRAVLGLPSMQSLKLAAAPKPEEETKYYIDGRMVPESEYKQIVEARKANKQ